MSNNFIINIVFHVFFGDWDSLGPRQLMGRLHVIHYAWNQQVYNKRIIKLLTFSLVLYYLQWWKSNLTSFSLLTNVFTTFIYNIVTDQNHLTRKYADSPSESIVLHGGEDMVEIVYLDMAADSLIVSAVGKPGDGGG